MTMVAPTQPTTGKPAACTIPCSAKALQAQVHGRLFGDLIFARLPVIGAALALLVGGTAVALLVGPVVTAVILAGWCIVGLAAVVGQAWLGASRPAREALPAELRRLVEQNAGRLHVARAPELRARAGALSLDQSNFDTYATHLLLDLREATGEAWRCPCRKRRLPLPLPF